MLAGQRLNVRIAAAVRFNGRILQVQHASEEFSRAWRAGELQPDSVFVGFDSQIEPKEATTQPFRLNHLGDCLQDAGPSIEPYPVTVLQIDPLSSATNEPAK